MDSSLIMKKITQQGNDIIITNTQTISVDEFISRKITELNMIENQLDMNTKERGRLEAKKQEIKDTIASYK